MAVAIRMPRPGQMTEECTVQAWLKAEGDSVHRGDVLFEIETDKSTMEVEAFDEGTLLRILVGVGQTAAVNTVVAWLGAAGEAIPDAGVGDAEPARRARLAISPRASRTAAELGVDPRSIAGSGPGGRIVERDVRAAATPGPASASAIASTTASGTAQPLSRLRQVIARRLTESIATIPQFDVTVAVDMTGLVAFREELRSDGSPITLTDLIHAATVLALVEHPLVNARTDGRSMWLRESVHLGVAVATPGGLLVPVVRDAERLGIAELHERTVTLVEAARAGKLGPDALSGSTFTVSNMGMFGVERFTAIVNPGESGILAVSSVLPEAVVIGEGIAVRQRLRLTLSADHRLVDGELGARFVGSVRRRLEDVETMRSAVGSAGPDRVPGPVGPD